MEPVGYSPVPSAFNRDTRRFDDLCDAFSNELRQVFPGVVVRGTDQLEVFVGTNGRFRRDITETMRFISSFR